MKTNQKVFSALEAILIVIVVGVLALAGWYVWKKNHDKESKNNPAVTQTQNQDENGQEEPDPYAGWKSSELVYEKIKYKYPENWNRQLESTPSGVTGTVKPGSDNLTLTGPDSEMQLVVRTGLDGVGSAVGQVVTDSVPVTLLGGQHYLNFYVPGDDEDQQKVYGACVDASKTSADKLPGKNITRANGENTPMTICVNFPRVHGDTLVRKTVDEYKKDPSFATIKLILESLTY